jgi:type I restriction enzyme R subunit
MPRAATIVRAFREELFTAIFSDGEWVPKTLIFAKDDGHATNINEMVREKFRSGNAAFLKANFE